MLRRILGVQSLRSHKLATHGALSCAIAHKTKFVFIANRKRVELSRAMKYVLPTRLSAAAPAVAAEWDFDRNSTFVFPEIVPIGSLKLFWWKCAKCGHSFESSPEKRIVRGAGCPACATAASQALETVQLKTTSDSRKRLRNQKKVSKKKKDVALLPGELDARNRPKHLTAHRSLLS